MGEERQKLLETLKEGAVVKGIVKNITDYGAFVDLGGIDGLLHITDLAWRRVKHPSEVLSVGDEVEAKVLKFDQEKNRVSLGLKQLGEDPWVGISRRYPQGTRLFGKVTNITDYGAFVEIESGIEGLVHVSEMDWTNKNVHPTKVVQLGDEVEVMILEIDEDRRRISLGMKQCMSNPWEEFAMNHKKGDKVRARSSRSPTSASSSACRATSTVWCTCPTCRGTSGRRGRAQVTRRARRSRPSCWRSTSSASASRSASSSSKATPSPTTSPPTTRTAIVRGVVKSIEAKGAVIALEKTTSKATCARRKSRGDQRRSQDAFDQPVDSRQGSGRAVRSHEQDGLRKLGSHRHDQPGCPAQGQAERAEALI
jgi:small subunit ribosomal protein S1